MAFTSLPSMRIIYFSNQPPEVVNAVIEGLEALGQQVLLLVTTPGPRARPSTEYQRTVANARRDLDILVTNHMSRLAGMLRTLEPDLIFTTGFSWRLPPELLALHEQRGAGRADHASHGRGFRYRQYSGTTCHRDSPRR